MIEGRAVAAKRSAPELAAAAMATVAAVVALGGAGCATRTAGVEQRLILPEGAARYEMQAHQAFVYPAPLENSPPQFPADFGARTLPPTTLCVGFVVAGDGSVGNLELLDQPGCIAAGRQPRLDAAVLEAVSAWHFEPAAFCDYPDAATRNRDWTGVGCAGAVAAVRPVAVSLAYAFTFEVREGRARIGATQVQAR